MIALETWRARTQFFQANGHQLAFWTSAQIDEERPWLVLIHGYPTSSWDWSAIWPALDQHFNLIAMDMLGFGLSDKPTHVKYSIFDQADLFEALLAHLSVGEAHIFAHDYGDTVAQELLARHHEGQLSFSAKSICFLNGGLFPEQHRARAIQKFGLTPLGFLIGTLLNRDKLRQNFDAIFGQETKASDIEIDGHWSLIEEHRGARVLHKLLQYIPERRANRERWVGAMQQTSIPLRLINGGFDPISGRHACEHYRTLIPNPDAVMFEDIGHYPHTEAPAQVIEAFFDFHHLPKKEIANER